jgi:general secretion pathway protein H
MSRTGRNIRNKSLAGRRRAGLTLIELVLVMAMLAAVLAIALPNLSRFFRGRESQEEVRRFLALTRYGRSVAISKSLVMELWIEPEAGMYGLAPQGSYDIEETDKTHIEFEVADGLSMAVDEEMLDEDGLVSILFWPDGSIDEESIESVTIVEDDDHEVVIAQTEYGFGYAVSETGDDEFGYEEEEEEDDTPWWQHDF